jgi:DNA end-binding protein Ku
VAARASWRGFLRIAELTCPVALHAAVSTADRLSFHTLNRATGNRVRRQFVDRETGAAVDAADQVKGCEVGDGQYVVLEPDEVAAAIPESDKTLLVESFVRCSEVDDVYLDRPYYLTPSGEIAQQSFAVIREGLRKKQVVALARALLFRRMRTLLIRPHENGLIATTLNFDYEVRPAAEVFGGLAMRHIAGEMLDLAKHIIETKRGRFDPSTFDDRYETALADLVRAKLAGKPVKVRKPAAAAKVIDLMDALRQSAAGANPSKRKTSPVAPKKATPARGASRRKAS